MLYGETQCIKHGELNDNYMSHITMHNVIVNAIVIQFYDLRSGGISYPTTGYI
jgi:hypothetical protein